MNIARRTILGVALSAATAALGCHTEPPPPPPPAPLPPPVQPVGPVAPGPGVPAGACDQAQLLASTTSMQARAAAEAPGMKPEGAPVCGVVGEGQTVVGPIFILEPGYCYTVLGQSLPPVGQMEMVLQADLGAAAGALLPAGMTGMAQMAQSPVLVSTTPGERVSMGEKQSCYQWAFPLPGTVKLILKSRMGGGPMAAQVYRKKK
jgi:hypothetical protein